MTGDKAPPVRSPLHDAFSGLAPARANACQRCGSATLSFANGRGRLDIYQRCGTAEGTTHEGVDLFRMNGLELRP